jgi:hypothetical protein
MPDTIAPAPTAVAPKVFKNSRLVFFMGFSSFSPPHRFIKIIGYITQSKTSSQSAIIKRARSTFSELSKKNLTKKFPGVSKSGGGQDGLLLIPLITRN